VKILHINTERGWRGGERQTLFTLKGLKKRGQDVALVAQADGALHKRAQEAGLKVFPLPVRGPFDLKAVSKIKKIVKQHSYEIVHTQTAHAMNLAILARGFSRRPRVVASRRVDFAVRAGWRFNLLDGVLSISEAIRKILVECRVDPDMISVIPSGVDTGIYEVDIPALRKSIVPNASHLIGTIGHLADHKGHKILLEAIPPVLSIYPDAVFVIVGDGELRKELEERAKFLNVEKSVVFTGFREDARNLIHAFDLYVQPSLMEGLCSTLLDVLLRKVPVIGSDVGGIPEVLKGGKYGRLVTPGDPAELAGEIIGQLGHKNDYIRKSDLEAGEQWVRERFDREKMVDDTLAYYQNIIAK
jgi:glycosyltransferase involved in cell wall biosynthesis